MKNGHKQQVTAAQRKFCSKNFLLYMPIWHEVGFTFGCVLALASTNDGSI